MLVISRCIYILLNPRKKLPCNAKTLIITINESIRARDRRNSRRPACGAERRKESVFRIFHAWTPPRTIDPEDENALGKAANFCEFLCEIGRTRATCPSSSDREANAIVKCSFDDESFSDLYFSRPRWSRSLPSRRLLGACLLRSTKMTTLGYFRNWRTKGHERVRTAYRERGVARFPRDNFRDCRKVRGLPNVAREKTFTDRFVGEILFDFRISSILQSLMGGVG
jgi:hypothetical protein